MIAFFMQIGLRKTMDVTYTVMIIRMKMALQPSWPVAHVEEELLTVKHIWNVVKILVDFWIAMTIHVLGTKSKTLI